MYKAISKQSVFQMQELVLISLFQSSTKISSLFYFHYVYSLFHSLLSYFYLFHFPFPVLCVLLSFLLFVFSVHVVSYYYCYLRAFQVYVYLQAQKLSNQLWFQQRDSIIFCDSYAHEGQFQHIDVVNFIAQSSNNSFKHTASFSLMIQSAQAFSSYSCGSNTEIVSNFVIAILMKGNFNTQMW